MRLWNRLWNVIHRVQRGPYNLGFYWKHGKRQLTTYDWNRKPLEGRQSGDPHPREES